MLKPISAFLLTSLFVAPMLAGACAPMEDLGGSLGDGGTRSDANSNSNSNTNGEAGPVTTIGSASDTTSLIYVMSEAMELYSFNPTTNQFVDIAASDCTGTPHSIAIDRSGNAYLLTYAFSGNFGPPTSIFYKMNLSTGHCQLTNNVSGEQGFVVFGMAFSANGSGSDETLYLQGAGDFQSVSGLATLDTNTFQLTVMPNSAKPILGGQLTGTGDGRLFGLFYTTTDQGPPYFGQIDKTNGNPISSIQQAEINTSDFSVAQWGGNFYFFMSDGYTSPQLSTVLRYSTTDGTVTNVATLQNAIILAAGVSTAAPQ
jgi:hypothetical protein